MSRICAVIVTYNRRELLLRNIKSIMKQNMDVDILIYDNASPDNPGEYLIENGLSVIKLLKADDFFTNEAAADKTVANKDAANKDTANKGIAADVGLTDYIHHLYIYRATDNTGGAGGFEGGMRLAYEAGYDYIWLMDDDGYCINENTLSVVYEEAQKRPKAIVNSYVLCNPKEAGGDDKMSHELFGSRYLDCEGEIAEGEICSFNSTFLPRKLVDEIGFVRSWFYIYGDDTDYLERAKLAGYALITVKNSRYFHPDSGNGDKKFLGHSISSGRITAKRQYYKVRNYMYICRKYRSLPFAVAHFFKVLLKTCLEGSPLKPTLHGLYDGIFTNPPINDEN